MFEYRDFVGIHFSKYIRISSSSKNADSGPLNEQSKSTLKYFDIL